MKRYLAFKGEVYYPRRGMGDFAGDFSTLAEAVEALTQHVFIEFEEGSMWALVWDSEQRCNVWRNT